MSNILLSYLAYHYTQLKDTVLLSQYFYPLLKIDN